MTANLTVRTATPDDAPALLAIYAPYVTDTAISWETEVPTVEEFRRRIIHTLETYPYLVAERGGEIVGYCCTGPFVGRAAYRWSAETTIYLRPDCQKQGVGKALYAELERISKAQNITNLYACIGVPVRSDEHLTDNSAEFHAHMGYRLVGRFAGCGWKFGRRYDMVWMEKRLAAPDEQPAPLIPFPLLERQAQKETRMKYTIRPIEPRDNAAIESIIRACLDEYGAPHVGTAWADPDLGRFSEIYNTDGNRYWVAVDETGAVVGGTGIGRLTDTVCELQKMYLLPPARGTGLAGELMTIALDYAKQYYTQCYLETLDNMTAAQKFYGKFGFVRVDKPVVETAHFSCDVRMLKDL